MPARRRATTRKLPEQERSRETVRVILEATARLLTKEGYDQTSTNRIAAAAGVSIGSLYQYFPNKDAIVGALLEDYSRQLIALVERSAVDLADVPLESAAQILVRALFDLHRRAPKLHRVLFQQITTAGNVQRRDVLLEHAHELLLGYFERHRDEIVVTNLDVAAFVAAHAIEGIAHAAVLHAQDRLADDELVDEAASMILRYLRKPA